MKPAVQQVLSLTGSASASLDSIARAIKQDHSLALKILKVANSPLYTRGERADTVQKAVSRIGVTQIRSTVLSLGVIDRFGNTQLGRRIRPDWFWEHSIACGLLAARINRMRGGSVEAADSMFTAGLLHDVGRMLYAERLGNDYARVIQTADELEMPLETVESRLLLLNHADLTDSLLRKWNFTTDLINPIALHHLSVGNIRRVSPKMAESVTTLGLANRLAHALLLGSSGNDSVYPIEEFVEFLGLSDSQLAELVEEVPESTRDMKLQMLSHGGEAGTEVAEDVRSQVPPALLPVHIGLRPQADSVAILLGRLLGDRPSLQPNVAILRVTHARERGVVLSRLETAEKDHATGPLPLLVVGNGTESFYKEGTLGGRFAVQVALPIRLTRLLRDLQGVCTMLTGAAKGP
jgi:HD-like signal output (HDOD) protein